MRRIDKIRYQIIIFALVAEHMPQEVLAERQALLEAEQPLQSETRQDIPPVDAASRAVNYPGPFAEGDTRPYKSKRAHCGKCTELPCALFDKSKDPLMSPEEHVQSVAERVAFLKRKGQ